MIGLRLFFCIMFAVKGSSFIPRQNPVTNVTLQVDTNNMTLEWPRSDGCVEWYSLRWLSLEGEGEAGARNLSAAGTSLTVRAELDGLKPGCSYTLVIAAHCSNLTSELSVVHTITRPLIQSEMTIIVNEPGNGDDNDTLSTTLKVSYTRTPASLSRFDSYRFLLEGADSVRHVVERAADAPGQAVLFTALVPGRLYNVTMCTVSRNVTSHPVLRQARLLPRPITQLKATKVGEREVTLAWDKPQGDYTNFEVQFLIATNQLHTKTTEELRVTLVGLWPNTLFIFSVAVRAGRPGSLRTASRALSAAVRTREAPPPAPHRFRPLLVAPRALLLAWELAPEDVVGGVLRRFLLEYATESEPERITKLEFPPDARTGNVTGLMPGTTYWLKLRAETGGGGGAAVRILKRTSSESKSGAATLFPALATLAKYATPPHYLRRSSSTVTVRLYAIYFSPALGNVTAYTLVLTEEPRKNTPVSLPSWHDVQALQAWPPYQVMEPYYPFHSSHEAEFTIGSERCDAGGRTYCNGPLKPETKYYVKLRAIIAPDKFTDTGYTVVYTGSYLIFYMWP